MDFGLEMTIVQRSYSVDEGPYFKATLMDPETGFYFEPLVSPVLSQDSVALLRQKLSTLSKVKIQKITTLLDIIEQLPVYQDKRVLVSYHPNAVERPICQRTEVDLLSDPAHWPLQGAVDLASRRKELERLQEHCADFSVHVVERAAELADMLSRGEFVAQAVNDADLNAGLACVVFGIHDFRYPEALPVWLTRRKFADQTAS